MCLMLAQVAAALLSARSFSSFLLCCSSCAATFLATCCNRCTHQPTGQQNKCAGVPASRSITFQTAAQTCLFCQAVCFVSCLLIFAVASVAILRLASIFSCFFRCCNQHNSSRASQFSSMRTLLPPANYNRCVSLCIYKALAWHLKSTQILTGITVVTNIVCRFLSGSLLFWLQDFNCCGIVGVS